MALTAPVVSWYNVDRNNSANSNQNEITQPYDFGIVDAGYIPTSEDYYSFLIWNNRNSTEIAPKMEEVTIGIKDMQGGNGNDTGNEVWAINGSPKWFWAKVDTLGETDSDFAQIGADLVKPIGTTATTTHPEVSNAVTWSASTSYAGGDIVAPTSDNGFIYKVTISGTSGSTEPTWTTTEGDTVTDGGGVQYKAIKKEKTPPNTNEILGAVNDGSMANAGANFAKVTTKIEVPLDAKAGRQDFKLRVSYRYV